MHRHIIDRGGGKDFQKSRRVGDNDDVGLATAPSHQIGGDFDDVLHIPPDAFARHGEAEVVFILHQITGRGGKEPDLPAPGIHACFSGNQLDQGRRHIFGREDFWIEIQRVFNQVGKAVMVRIRRVITDFWITQFGWVGEVIEQPGVCRTAGSERGQQVGGGGPESEHELRRDGPGTAITKEAVFTIAPSPERAVHPHGQDSSRTD